MTLSRDMAGSGAMLARLLGVGARCGLTPEITLLHVLDGVPLPHAAIVIPRLTPESLERLREAAAGHIGPGPVPVVDGATHPAPAVPNGFGTDTSVADLPDGLNADAIERELGPDCWSGPRWTPAKGSKADRALDLWSTTQIDVDEIATRLGSTPGAIRSIVKKARRRGEPRAKRAAFPPPPGTVEAIVAAKALPLKRDRAILLWERTRLRTREIAEVTGSTPPAVSYCLKVARRENNAAVLAGDVRRGFKAPAQHQAAPESENLPEGASEGPRSQVQILPGDSVAFEGAPVAQAGRAGQSGDVGSNPAQDLPDSSMVRAPSHTPEGAEECAEPVVEPSTDRPLDGAFPAPPPAQDPGEMGTVRQDEPPPVSAPAPDTADRPAGPGLESVPSDRTEALLEAYGGTSQLQKDIGTKLGLRGPEVSIILKMYRTKKDPRVLAGDIARTAAKEPGKAFVPASAKIAPGVAAKAAVAAKVQAPPAAATGPLPPGDLVELKQGQVLAVDRGWIIGPAGAVKGFPLVNGALAALASGDLFPSAVIAQRSGARSGDAVLQQLQFWREDLARIGVEVVRVGAADVRLRRKEA